ncbi:progranulin-like [Myxocyprinus asiaticus]|uniref:progranulin-like n=1 Tax=Myxocyprinus asiaticus TaxID=70543 RepID=UPI002221CB13|nr:progranulin-like [Myxocyprinus asiaticus]
MVLVLVLLMAALVAADDPMTDLLSQVESDSASPSVVHCDAITACPDLTTCCRSPYGLWFCCPYMMGQCCRDGVHCCRHGYTCDSTSTRCLRGWLRLPSTSPQLASKAIQKTQSVLLDQDLEWKNQAEVVHCDGDVYCPAEKLCCKTRTDQWGCCSGKPDWPML